MRIVKVVVKPRLIMIPKHRYLATRGAFLWHLLFYSNIVICLYPFASTRRNFYVLRDSAHYALQRLAPLLHAQSYRAHFA